MYTVVAPVPHPLITALTPYRQQFDPQANLAPPHISILEPFQFTANPEPLLMHLSGVSEDYAPIRVFLAGWDICQAKAYQLHLPLMAGQAELLSLRRDLLSGVLSMLGSQHRTYQPGVLFGHVTEENKLVIAKQTLKNFEPFFNFRVGHMELWQREETNLPWNLVMKFSLKGTVVSTKRQKN
jgi:hypothetical protein